MVLAATAARASTIGTVTADGYTFTTVDFPGAGNAAGAGTNINGISNNGAAVGFSIGNDGNFSDFVRNPDGTVTPLNLSGLNPLAFGINSSGDVVGQLSTGPFFVAPGASPQTLANEGAPATAFGINDKGNIVGQFTAPTTGPGFYLAGSTGNGRVQIDGPGPDVVSAQGINDNGLIVGLYLGTDGEDHGFEANINNASNGELGITPIADPSIPSQPGEPGATFVFAQLLGVNDSGIAVGYYEDSTGSQHGFLYNTNTGAYTFVDDPLEQFDNGVETTEITGINNLGEIAGFYSDSAGVFHGFLACPAGMSCSATAAVPEPGAGMLASLGLGLVVLGGFRRRRAAAGAQVRRER